MGYREGIYSVNKGVNGVNVIATGGCCGSIKERVSVDCFDAESSESAVGVTEVQAVAQSVYF